MCKDTHAERKHALLSASGSHKWLNCPPSARLEENFENKSSIYAEEGTLAHEISEQYLLLFTKRITKTEFSKKIENLKKNKFYSNDMIDEIQKYCRYVMEEFLEAQQKVKDSVLLIESKVDFSHIIQDGFGTLDSGIVSDKILQIVDLKYGKGVKVSAQKNEQLMLYGLGALKSFELMYDIDTIKITICQPRLDHIDTYSISSEELIKWGEEYVKPTAELAYQGKGNHKTGDWCRWCKAQALCKKLADKNMEITREEFAEPSLLDLNGLISIYKQFDQIESWMESVRIYLLEEAKKGTKIEGYKLVEGRSNRKWINEEKTIQLLKTRGHDEKEFLNIKLKGLSDIEKLVSKGVFQTVFTSHIVKPPGAPTLVEESDKRPELGIGQAVSDFKD